MNNQSEEPTKVVPKEDRTGYSSKKKQMIFSLDTYDDIFSDFDPRPYSLRSISDDFLEEARKASKGCNKEIIFLVPKSIRSFNLEHTIKKRLKEHFRKHAEIEDKKLKKMINQGIVYVILGNMLILARAVLLYNEIMNKSFFAAFFTGFLETPSWFLIFEGLIMIIFKSRKQVPETLFYDKLKNSTIEFRQFD